MAVKSGGGTPVSRRYCRFDLHEVNILFLKLKKKLKDIIVILFIKKMIRRKYCSYIHNLFWTKTMFFFFLGLKKNKIICHVFKSKII